MQVAERNCQATDESDAVLEETEAGNPPAGVGKNCPCGYLVHLANQR